MDKMYDIIVNGESEEVEIPSWLIVNEIVDAERLKYSAQALLKMGAKARDIAFMIKNMLEDSLRVEDVVIEEDEEYDIYNLRVNLYIDDDDDEDYEEDEDEIEESNEEFVYKCSCCEHPENN